MIVHIFFDVHQILSNWIKSTEMVHTVSLSRMEVLLLYMHFQNSV